MERRLAAILAADVVGYSRLMGLSEAGTLAALKSHRRELVDGRIAEHQGRIVKLTGDGMLVEFPSVVNAVACAVEIQRRMQERNADVPADRRIEFRIGVNLGDIIVEDNDIFGDGVNVAARVEAFAQPGGVSVTAAVRENVGNRLELVFEDMGEQALKNIERPVRVFNVALGLLSPGHAPARQTPAVALAKPKPSIAVLPFNNMSGDPEQEYFSDGITEDIITDLSKISGLSVIARNSVFTYKGKPTDVQEVSRRFNVATVLEGSVRKAGQRVRITAQLVNGADGVHLWADRFDRDLTDIFVIQDEITKTIVEQLKVKLLPAEKGVIAQAPTGNVEAYTYYLRGRQFFHRHSRSYYVLAKRMFSKAVELDPRYARAYAGIADCDSFLFLHYQVNIPVQDILATADKALDLESGLAEAHASRGLALSLVERHADAEREFQQAIALNPDLYEARYFYGRACFAQGDFPRAAAFYEQAIAIRPDDYQSQILIIAVYRSLGRDADALEAARKGIELAQKELVANPENPRPAYAGAIALAQLGEADRAREWAARALAIDPDDILTQYNVACVHSLLGEREAAIAMLERLLPHANQETKAWIKQDSDFASLHGHPYWQRVLALTS